MIEEGDRILILPNLLSELQRLNKCGDGVQSFVDKWQGKRVKVAYIYHDAPLICDGLELVKGCNEWMVCLNNRVEIPMTSCKLIEKKKKGDKHGDFSVIGDFLSSH